MRSKSVGELQMIPRNMGIPLMPAFDMKSFDISNQRILNGMSF